MKGMMRRLLTRLCLWKLARRGGCGGFTWILVLTRWKQGVAAQLLGPPKGFNEKLDRERSRFDLSCSSLLSYYPKRYW